MNLFIQLVDIHKGKKLNSSDYNKMRIDDYKKMGLTELQNEAYESARNRGFYTKDTDIENRKRYINGIMHEVKEALEACDNQKFYLDEGDVNPKELDYYTFEKNCKDTVEDELADIIIYALSVSKALNVDIESHVLAKMNYNRFRNFMKEKRK